MLIQKPILQQHLAAALQADAENYTADEITEVVAGVKDGKVIGLVVTVVAGDGYGGDIKFSVGVGAGRYIPRNINSVDFRNSRSWYACKDKPGFPCAV